MLKRFFNIVFYSIAVIFAVLLFGFLGLFAYFIIGAGYLFGGLIVALMLVAAMCQWSFSRIGLIFKNRKKGH